jgi:hypothetical protein
MSDIETAFAKFNESMNRMAAAFRSTARAMRLLGARNKKLRRRLERDFAREDRRPSLIHNGKKPR